MKISELEIKDIIAREPTAEDNSFIIVNHAVTDSEIPVTYRITLKELSNMIINNHHLLRYTGDGDKNLTSVVCANNDYSITNSLGQFVDDDDRAVLDNTITNVTYDGEEKKFTLTTRNDEENTADIVTVA